jgi:hypothetical protein
MFWGFAGTEAGCGSNTGRIKLTSAGVTSQVFCGVGPSFTETSPPHTQPRSRPTGADQSGVDPPEDWTKARQARQQNFELLEII